MHLLEEQHGWEVGEVLRKVCQNFSPTEKHNFRVPNFFFDEFIDEFFFILWGSKETDAYFSDDTQTDINKQLNEINMACQMECFIDLLDFYFL